MASFRTHISFGIASGILGVITLFTMAIVNVPSLLIAIFALATLGSVLPDMDSDTSVPFHVAFGSLTIVTTVLVFSTLYKEDPRNWFALLSWTGGVAFFIWGVIGYLFKKLTRHRGMAHSIPAAILAGLITFFVASRLYFSDPESFLLGISMIIGYTGHLIVDEVHAALNFHGKAFIPNKAFGSAFKLKSHSHLVNFLVFSSIIFLAAGNIERFSDLAQTFWSQIS